jgi:hypothetical protein
MKRKALALFSGGLDSILAARLIQDQGVEVVCLHFVSPFFGHPDRVDFWRGAYGLEVRVMDIGEDFVRLLRGPAHGFGSVLNPCVDCKILMLRRAGELMDEEGACCVISGEVLGQRPMSQRRDALNIIQRDAGLKGRLLRPLCALHLDPTRAENEGLVDRSRLLGITGRGRKRQLELAGAMGITDFPAPAGGCRLTEQENARSYWPILQHAPRALAVDFHLANTGRQFWLGLEGQDAADSAPASGEGVYRLIIGRKQDDNTRLMELAGERDIVFKIRDFPGPVAVARFMGRDWPEEVVRSAAAFVASYCPKAVRHASEGGQAVAVRAHRAGLDGPGRIAVVMPQRENGWREHGWEETKTRIAGQRGR